MLIRWRWLTSVVLPPTSHGHCIRGCPILLARCLMYCGRPPGNPTVDQPASHLRWSGTFCHSACGHTIPLIIGGSLIGLPTVPSEEQEYQYTRTCGVQMEISGDSSPSGSTRCVVAAVDAWTQGQKRNKSQSICQNPQRSNFKRKRREVRNDSGCWECCSFSLNYLICSRQICWPTTRTHSNTSLFSCTVTLLQ